MGRNHARILAQLEGALLSGVFDVERSRADSVASAHGVPVCSSPDDLIAASDAVVVSAPTTVHRMLAEKCIAAGRHVLVEKPLAATAADAEAVARAADRAGVALLVGHIERFSPVLMELRSLLARERILSISARRMSPPTPHIEVDVVFDLMIHDLDLLRYLTGRDLVQAAAVGVRLGAASADLVLAHVVLDGGILCDLTASKVALHKIREMVVSARGAFATADLISGQLVVYRKAIPEFVPDHGTARFREETVVEHPYVANAEPLRNELEHFLDCVRGRCSPLMSGAEGVEAIRMAEAVTRAVAEQRVAADALS